MMPRLPHVMKMLPLLSCLAFTAFAVEELPPPELAPLPPAESAPAPVVRDSDLAVQITRELRDDPLFLSITLNVDLYNGLAIVHGGAPSQAMIDAVNQKLRTKPGIEIIYNYMSSPDQPVATAPQSIVATYDSFRRDRADGSVSRAFMIAGQTLERLRADPALSGFDLQVDSYRDLVILHGSVADAILVNRAKSIAEHTEGVSAVLSYLNVSAPVAAFMTVPVEIGAPILSRSTLELVPASYERIERITPAGCCGECH